MPKDILCIRHLGHENFWKILYDAAQIPTHHNKTSELATCVPLLLTLNSAEPGGADAHAADRLLAARALIELGALPQSYCLQGQDARERLLGDAPLFSSGADMCLCYGLPQKMLAAFAERMTIPVLNASSRQSRLCAALGDIALLRALSPDLDKIRIAWVGGATPLAHSLIEASMYVPFELFMALPEWGEADRDMLGLALNSGAKIFLTREPRLAVDEAHYVYVGAGYTDCQAAPHARPAAPRSASAAPLQPLQAPCTLPPDMRVDSPLLQGASPHVRLLLGAPWSPHCCVESSLLESPLSLYAQQLEYAVRLQKILFPWLLHAQHSRLCRH